MKSEPHFISRARDRGFGDIAEQLHSDLFLAARRLKSGMDADGDFIEHVMDAAGEGAAIWRFATQDGRMGFALMCDGRPVTLLTKHMVKNYKAIRGPGGAKKREAMRALNHVRAMKRTASE